MGIAPQTAPADEERLERAYVTGSLAGGFYLAAAVALAAFALSLGPADGRRDRVGP